jgi:hypothetical protein
VLRCLRQLDPFLGGHLRLGEGPALRQRDDKVAAGKHGGQPRQPEVLVAERALEHATFVAKHATAR